MKLKKQLDMTFPDIVETMYDNKEFMQQYDRLKGTSFAETKTPLTAMIDKATGKPPFTEAEGQQFIKDIKDIIWDRMPHE